MLKSIHDKHQGLHDARDPVRHQSHALPAHVRADGERRSAGGEVPRFHRLARQPAPLGNHVWDVHATRSALLNEPNAHGFCVGHSFSYNDDAED
jgi:hypothetical protein